MATRCQSRTHSGPAGPEGRASRGHRCSLVKGRTGSQQTEAGPEKGAAVKEEGARPPCPPLPVARLPRRPSMPRAPDKQGFIGNGVGPGRAGTPFPPRSLCSQARAWAFARMVFELARGSQTRACTQEALTAGSRGRPGLGSQLGTCRRRDTQRQAAAGLGFWVAAAGPGVSVR